MGKQSFLKVNIAFLLSVLLAFTAVGASAEYAPEQQEEAPLIEIAGTCYYSDAQYLILADCGQNGDELAQKLSEFPRLCSVDMRYSGISEEACFRLTRQYPAIDFIYPVDVCGKSCLSDSEELDLSGILMEDSSGVEEKLKYFPNLKRVVMCDCGILDEDMDALNKRYDDIRFVWMVHFSVYSLRTDAVYFCASDIRSQIAPGLNSSQLQPLKYCTDLEALDLGHMQYKDLSFLEGLTKMKYLILVQGHFSDISVIGTMPDLVYLELFNNNGIVDISPLLNCKKLTNLNLGYCYYLNWEPLKEMTQLERLWIPHVGLSNAEKKELSDSLSNTQIHFPLTDSMGSTGNGWRDQHSYYEMRAAFHMYLLPGGTGM